MYVWNVIRILPASCLKFRRLLLVFIGSSRLGSAVVVGVVGRVELSDDVDGLGPTRLAAVALFTNGADTAGLLLPVPLCCEFDVLGLTWLATVAGNAALLLRNKTLRPGWNCITVKSITAIDELFDSDQIPLALGIRSALGNQTTSRRTTRDDYPISVGDNRQN